MGHDYKLPLWPHYKDHKTGLIHKGNSGTPTTQCGLGYINLKAIGGFVNKKWLCPTCFNRGILR